MSNVLIEFIKMVGGVVLSQVGRVVCDKMMEKNKEKKNKKNKNEG